MAMVDTGLFLTSGMVLGFTAGIAPGPLATLVVTHTLRHGVRAGILIALAPIISDLPIIGASLWLAAHLPDDPWPIGLISLTGGAYLVYLAWSSLAVAAPAPDAPTGDGKALKKGALVNLLNPHPYLFWLTIGTPLLLKMWPHEPWVSAGWLLGFYAMLVGAKIALALMVGRTRQWLNNRGYIWLNRALGLLLCFFALVLLHDGLGLLCIIK